MARKALVAGIALIALAGCAANPDGSRSDIFSDVGTLAGGSEGLSPAQRELRERERDYAGSRVAAAGGALLGGLICAAAGGNAAEIAACAAGGGALAYVGSTYLTRDNQQFVASRDSLEADIAEARAEGDKAESNLALARDVLAYQRAEIDRLNQGYRAGSVSAAAYEAKLAGIAGDIASVRTMREQSEERVAALRQTAGSYKNAGLNARELDREAQAQARQAQAMRQVEDDMLRLLERTPPGVQVPAV